MILYVNGDSNGAGAELSDQSYSWASLLSKRLELQLLNQSKSGGSNPRILRTTQDYITNSQDAFVVIGWTGWEREEWQMGHAYYDVNSGGHDKLPPYLKLKYKSWVVEQTQEERIRKQKDTHEQIYKLHQQLTTSNIPHLFFNALMHFSDVDKEFDWGNNYLNPYSGSSTYYLYLKNAGFVPTALYHHLEAAHAAWADVLYDHIQTNKLL